MSNLMKGAHHPKKVRVLKATFALTLSLACMISFSSCQKKEKAAIVLATTTSVNDSGLLDVLKPVFEADTGIKVNVVSQGTGQAVKTGENGDADVLLIHDKTSEEKFVSDGYGVKRIELMYNYFVVVGPKSDPAGVKALTEKTADKAFTAISAKQAVFVSRGDDSGTNKKEVKIWKAAGITPAGSWYVSAGKGMGDVLTMTSEKQGYTLTDKATFLSMKSKLDLEIVLESVPDLKNQYTVIAVNPDKLEGINAKGAQEFVDWMTSRKALDLIAKYGVEQYGESLFTVNYKAE